MLCQSSIVVKHSALSLPAPAHASNLCRDLVTGAILAANEAYNQALQLDNNYPEPRLNIAALHHQYGDVADAIVQYRYLLASFDALDSHTRIMVYMNLAQALLDMGNVTDAIAGTPCYLD